MSDHKLKVLMFGWEFPPFNSGGLGTACFGMSKALSDKNVSVTFVLPKHLALHSDVVDLKFADDYLPNLSIKAVKSILSPYQTSESYEKLRRMLKDDYYGQTLLEEVKLYALRARKLAESLDFDVIHAHDWLAFGAGLAAKEVSGKPLVVHVHATEFDRTGGSGVNQEVYDLECEGLQAADKIVTVSDYTKKIVIDRYGVIHTKISVVHNGIEFSVPGKKENPYKTRLSALKKAGQKIVLFVGRITIQKGPDYFIKAARKVLSYYPNVIFVMAGSGDMEHQVMRQAAALGISDKVIFTGFLRGAELDELYKYADLYVMPSVSEPFGITALEAVRNGAPVLVSKQSGVSEVLRNAMRVDFWDVDEMANKIVAVLYHESLGETVRGNTGKELPNATWHHAADKLINIYRGLAHGM